jgi:gliding motility-associated-like protein
MIMRKCLLLVALLLLTQLNKLSAQKLTPSVDTMFYAPDTVCIHEPVPLKSNIFNAANYYWGFCSGYQMNAPTGINLGKKFHFHIPSDINVVYDSGSYYGFVINSQTRELLRLNFGNSLSNVPTVTNFDSLKGGLAVNPTSLYILKDTFSHNWYIFITGGFTPATSTLGRVDFGPHLSNPRPNVANFGNYNGMLNFPKGIFVAQDGNNNWYGYLVNEASSELIRLDFAFNVSNTPLMQNLGNIPDQLNSPTLSNPTDIAAVKDKGKWYLFVTNAGSGTLARIDLGTTLDTQLVAGDMIGNSLGNFNFRINWPSSITINKDCGEMYAYITDSTTSQLVGIRMPEAIGPYYAIDYNNIGLMNYPSAISSIIRDKDNIYGFVTNPRDSTLTQIDFFHCTNSSIPSYTEVNPPLYSYNSPGVYNIYMVVNQGLPTQQVNCKPITVLAYPPINMNTDTTICEGDTIRLYAKSNLADSIIWTGSYNIDTTYLYGDSVRVWPDYSVGYPVVLYYPFGCVVDTEVRVHVSKVHADAGPDRWIGDGKTTTLGGPNTSFFSDITLTDTSFSYHWFPFEFLSDSDKLYPVANPPYDYTYYLTVIENNDKFKCQSMDTVVVHINCADIVLPNVFSPNSANSATNRFYILNHELIKLNYFRVYDRWGALVFETTNPTIGWDGTYNGQPAPVDVYVWEADAFCTSGKEITKRGNVTLLR